MKTCKQCGFDNPMTEYYQHKEMADGHLNKCKSCVRSRIANYVEKNADKVKQYDKIRNKLPHRVEAKKAYAKTEKGKLALRKTHKNYVKNYPLRYAAHIITGNAIRDGKLVRQPCFICGGKSEAHHPDYSRPLDVVWLCDFHHKQAHNVSRKGEGYEPSD